MRVEDLKPNTIVHGALFPEPIQISITIPMGDLVRD
jgi:hypothetical protein